MTSRRWTFVAPCVVAVLFAAVSINQFNQGRPGFGWGLIVSAVLMIGGYVVSYVSYVWGLIKQRRQPTAGRVDQTAKVERP